MSYLNRPIKDVVYVDWTDEPVAYHKNNAIILKKFEGEEEDRDLIDLIPFLDHLAKTNRESCKLYTTGAWPQQYHGQQAIGMSSTSIARARADMVKCSGMPRGCCTSCLVSVAYGLHTDPVVRNRKEQIGMWKKVWTALPPRDQARMTVDYRAAYE